MFKRLHLLLIIWECTIATEIQIDVTDNPVSKYILVLGLSGCGKSSMINELVNYTVAEVGSTTSTTRDITEYRISLPDYENAELRIIDTPGLEDTGGVENDARFLATLEEYLENHNELKYRSPDVVLICSRFDDNRYSGEGSRFVKMLRGISLLISKIVNPRHSNLIFVLTHFLSGPIKSSTNPASHLKSVENTIKEYTLFPSPLKMVVAENQAAEQMLEEVDNGYLMPNKDVYPENLCLALKLLITRKEIGYESQQENWESFMNNFCNIRRNRTEIILKGAHGTDLLKGNDVRVASFLGRLVAAQLNTEETEISKSLKAAFEGLSRTYKLQSTILPILQGALHLRQITKIEDLPKRNVDIAILYQHLGNLNETEILLKAAFGLQAPRLPFHILVGKSYDIVEDRVMQSSIFKINEKKISRLGYLIPSGISIQEDKHVKVYHEHFASEEEYQKSRLSLLDIPSRELTSEMGNIKPGYNLLQSGSCPSVLAEIRTVKFQIENLELSHRFLSKVKALPHINDTNPRSIQKWEMFFDAYGTHVVTKSYAGGSVHFDIHGYSCSAPNLRQTVKNILELKDDPIVNIKNINAKKSIDVDGGSSKFQMEDPVGFFKSDKLGVPSYYQLWKESLAGELTNLNTEVQIKPMWEFLQNTEPSLATKISNAYKYLFEIQPEQQPALIAMETRIGEFAIKFRNEEEKYNLTITELNKAKSKLGEINTAMIGNLSQTINKLSQAQTDLLNEKSSSSSLRNQIGEKDRIISNKESQLVSKQLTIDNLQADQTYCRSSISRLEQELTNSKSQTSRIQQSLTTSKTNFMHLYFFPACEKDKKRCDNGKCIKDNYVRDGDNDCGDGSDENQRRSDCSTSDQFRCNNGNCVSNSYICDGDNDCGDGSDEHKETCDPNATCDNSYPGLRIDCGWPHIHTDVCRSRKCCVDQTIMGYPHCFYKRAQ